MSTKFGRLEFSGKIFSFTKSSITQTREKWDSPVLSRPDFWMAWRCHGILFVHFYFYFYFFCLEATLGQDRATSATVMVIFSKVPFRKLLYHSYVKVFFSTIAKHINNSILKDTLRLKILWPWINIQSNSFIKALVNNMKRKSTKVL